MNSSTWGCSGCWVQVRQSRGVPKGAGGRHPAVPKRKSGLFARLSRMSGNLNPFEEEETNPRHKSNLQMTVGKVGGSRQLLRQLCLLFITMSQGSGE